MRSAWAVVTFTLALAAAAGAQGGGAASSRCSWTLPPVPAGLPAPVVVTTDCGRFELEPSGTATFKGPLRSPVPRLARAYWIDLRWYGYSHGHLLIGKQMRRLWRSAGLYHDRHASAVGNVAVGASGVAFSFFRGRHSRLYLARYGRAERPVARDETPLALTGSGNLVTWRDRSGALLLRSRSGLLARQLSPHAVEPQADAAGRVIWRARGTIFVFDGSRARALASLARLGIAGVPVIEPLGRLIAVHDRRRLVLVDYAGRVVASTVLPRDRYARDGVSSSVSANRSWKAVAYTVTSRNLARETVYVLEAGERHARPLFTERIDFAGCERAAWLAWSDGWLLYGNSQQEAAVIDSSAEGAAIELGGVIARLPGSRPDRNEVFQIGWA